MNARLRYDRIARDRIKEHARDLRKRNTAPEYHLKMRLKRRGEKRVLRQCVVGRLIVDLGLPFRNLLVEVDDPSHEDRRDKDRKRDRWLSNLGFNVLRVTNDDVLRHPAQVLTRIEAFPECEENRYRFFMSLRAARAQAFWKREDDPYFESASPEQRKSPNKAMDSDKK